MGQLDIRLEWNFRPHGIENADVYHLETLVVELIHDFPTSCEAHELKKL